MRILFWLIVAFGAGTLIVAWITRAISARAVRWRGQVIAYASKDGATRRAFQDIAGLRSTLWGSVHVQFVDGSALWLDPNATGAQELIDANNAFLDSKSEAASL